MFVEGMPPILRVVVKVRLGIGMEVSLSLRLPLNMNRPKQLALSHVQYVWLMAF
jgi:hypothetical protein